MEHIFSAIIPVFSLILLGYFFKKISFPSQEFWPMADRLTYYILMPSLLIFELSKAKFESNNLEFILTSLIAIFLTLFSLMIYNKIYPTLNNSFTSIVQGGIRFNTYIFLALSGAIFGEKGIVLSAIILTFTIPILNIICITIFALYSQNNKLSLIYLIKSIITNPLIIGCVIGGTINFMGVSMPVSLENLLQILSKSALPLGLLSIGYALVLKELGSSKKDLFISCFAKFIVLPVFMFLVGKFYGLDETMLAILILFSILPTAPSSFILARQLNGDLSLMTSIITVQTLLSALFIILFLKLFI